ncbi:MAG TPA: methyltransferase domain-containing protein [Candidatus Hydrogenedentes bacterium]|nr:methyltransferase domain-containing protein [Candidatus Hydrogenedentota bacterium]
MTERKATPPAEQHLSELPENRRRTGDTVTIDGGYQHRAMHSPNAVQRFWHHAKKFVIADMLPPTADDAVLDIGCGSGVITSFLGEHAAHARGIDGNPDAIAYAREHFTTHNVAFQHTLVDDAFDIEAPPQKLYCLELVEHVYFEQAVALLKNLRRIAAQDAKLLLTTPNYRSLWPLIEWFMDHCTDAPTLDAHQHVFHYTRTRLAKLAIEGGWEIQDIRTILFLSPWIAPLSWNTARQLYSIEAKTTLIPGSIIVAVLRRNNA